MRFVFYDTETTGRDKDFDQILQFGAILTDEQFRELDRFEIRCRILPYVVPSPSAMMITRIRANQLEDPGLPSHYEMMRQIHERLRAWSPAIFIGHNSLGFDEHFLRQAFYKSLFNPYLTNMGGNGRHDTLKIFRAAAFLHPNILTIPIGDNNQQIFKLDKLAPINGFDHSNAHDAMVDVEAIMFLCDLLNKRIPYFIREITNLGIKKNTLTFLNTKPYFVALEHYGANSYWWPLTKITSHSNNSSSVFCLDLNNDPEDLSRMDDSQLQKVLSQKPKIVRTLKINSGPVLIDHGDLSEENKNQGPDRETLNKRASYVKNNPEFRRRIRNLMVSLDAEYEESEHVERQIYSGFIQDNDAELMKEFHESTWPNRYALLKEFSEPRLVRIGKRIVFTESPETLSPQVHAKLAKEVSNRISGSEADQELPWLTIPQALQQIDQLLSTNVQPDRVFLKEHKDALIARLSLDRGHRIDE